MVDFERKQRYNAQDLVRIVALLRDPVNGCPWDKEQTHESIRSNFIEETYEALEAIDLADAHLLEEELGDVLLQVALHCQMEAEKGVFDFDAVCDGICKKLIYRHPHVFGDTVADTTGQVLANWEALKNAEKERTTAKSRLESVPAAFPALMRAAKVQKRAGAYGFAYPDAAAALADLESELAELKEAMASGGDVQWELAGSKTGSLPARSRLWPRARPWKRWTPKRWTATGKRPNRPSRRQRAKTLCAGIIFWR